MSRLSLPARRRPVCSRPAKPLFPSKPCRMPMEPLEGRILLATFVVTNTLDSGDGSLRQAMIDANANLGHDEIHFNIQEDGGATDLNSIDLKEHYTILVSTPLPAIVDPVDIDGRTQPGYEGTPIVEVSPAPLAPPTVAPTIQPVANYDGFVIETSCSSISGLAINGFDSGILITSGDNAVPASVPTDGQDSFVVGKNHIFANFIGTDTTGCIAKPNVVGITILASEDNTIGVLDCSRCANIKSGGNLISGNLEFGIFVIGTLLDGAGSPSNTLADNSIIVPFLGHNTIAGNWIGLDSKGKAALPNGLDGVRLAESDCNRIINNVISGNLRDGISYQVSYGNTIACNRIGTDPSGLCAIGNGRDGIYAEGILRVYPTGALNTDGNDARHGEDTIIGKSNVISGNGLNGIEIDAEGFTRILGNYIGTDISGCHALPNGGDGIELYTLPDNVIGVNSVGAYAPAGADIGGTGEDEGNIISGNTGNGVHIGPGYEITILKATNNSTRPYYEPPRTTIVNNAIGAGKDDHPVSNCGDGVQVDLPNANVLIGGCDRASGNLIAFNYGNGVTVACGGEIIITGQDAAGDGAEGTAILTNSIFCNGGLGIALEEEIPQPGIASVDQIPNNNCQSAPVLCSAKLLTSGRCGRFSGIQVNGCLLSTPHTKVLVQFFANKEGDPSGYGEGQCFLGEKWVTTDCCGHASFSFVTSAVVKHTQVITATATGPDKNTSEFSNWQPIACPPPPPPPPSQPPSDPPVIDNPNNSTRHTRTRARTHTRTRVAEQLLQA